MIYHASDQSRDQARPPASPSPRLPVPQSPKPGLPPVRPSPPASCARRGVPHSPPTTHGPCDPVRPVRRRGAFGGVTPPVRQSAASQIFLAECSALADCYGGTEKCQFKRFSVVRSERESGVFPLQAFA